MVLVEASEMTGSTKAEVETIKKFLSRTNDNIRLTYRRDPSPLLRRCMIVGTTNDPRCLPNDASGNRRFLPVQCDRGRSGQHTGLPRGTPRAAVGRSHPPGPHEPRDRLPPRQPEGRPGRTDRTVPGGRRGRRGSHRIVARREPAGGHREPGRHRHRLDPRQPEHLPHHDRPQADELHPVQEVRRGRRAWVWTPPGGPAQLEF